LKKDTVSLEEKRANRACGEGKGNAMYARN